MTKNFSLGSDAAHRPHLGTGEPPAGPGEDADRGPTAGERRDTWADEQAALLRGLAHALSNRVGTIGAVAGMLTRGAPAPAAIVGVLQDESARLEEVLGLMRLLAGEADDPGPEPLHLPDIVHPAVALHSHHPDVRDVPCTVEETPLGVAVRASHGGLTRALLVLLTSAKDASAEGARVTWSEAPDAVVVLIGGGRAGDHAAATAATRLLGGAGAVSPVDDGYRMTLPRLG